MVLEELGDELKDGFSGTVQGDGHRIWESKIERSEGGERDGREEKGEKVSGEGL